MNDSTLETKQHIATFEVYMEQLIHNLIERLAEHDQTKLIGPEKPVYDRFTPMLKNVAYGTTQYKARLADMMEALEHHYRHNDHHPEHFENGIEGMSLLSLLEMIADWKAATLRHTDGNIHRSIEISRDRHGLSGQLASILHNTAREMGWD